MVLAEPPRRLPGVPNRLVQPAGTVLWRTHSRKYPADAFNHRSADRHFGGSRFDSTKDDPYGFLYAAYNEQTALAETLLRGLPFGTTRARHLPRQAVAGRRLSTIRTTQPISLLQLTSHTDLAAVGQDEWLVQSEERDYPFTRRWASWLRTQVPWAQGLVWPSKRNLGERCLLLFADRCDGLAVEPGPAAPIELDDTAGAKWLNDLLTDYRVTLLPPREPGL